MSTCNGHSAACFAVRSHLMKYGQESENCQRQTCFQEATTQKTRSSLSIRTLRGMEENTHIEMLKPLAEQIQNVHLNNQYHGKLSPFAIEIDCETQIMIKCNKDCVVDDEWRPFDQSDPQKSDVFALGCIFFYILTRGNHPFGQAGFRSELISKNLYQLSDCENSLAQRLIEQMIAFKAERRPSMSEVLKNPLFWSKDEIENFLKSVAKEVESDEELKNEIDKFNINVIQPQSTNSYQTEPNGHLKNISDILKAIGQSEKTNCVFTWHELFPELLPTVFYIRKQCSVERDCYLPIRHEFGFTAAESFGSVVLKDVKNQCQIRFGRLGGTPVYALKISKTSENSRDLLDTFKKLGRVKHKNIWLHWRPYDEENFSYIPIEPFSRTLSSYDFDWTPNKVEYVIIQIAEGLAYLHDKGIIHGTLSPAEVIIHVDSRDIEAKIVKFVTGDDEWGLPAASKDEDMRRLGCIAYWLLSGGKHPFGDSEDRKKRLQSNDYAVGNLDPISEHLVLTMLNSKSEENAGAQNEFPLSLAILFHPFNWSKCYEIWFYRQVLVALESNLFDDVYPISMENPSDLLLKSWLESRKLIPQTNVEAIKLIVSIDEDHEKNESNLPADLSEDYPDVFINSWNALYPKLLLRTWITFQRFKDLKNLSEFYRSYNFDPQTTLSEISNHCSTNFEMRKPTTGIDLKSRDMSYPSSDQFSVLVRVPGHCLESDTDYKNTATTLECAENKIMNQLAEMIKRLQHQIGVNGECLQTTLHIDNKSKKIVVTWGGSVC